VTVQLGHEALAETHNFCIGLALRVKVGAALAAAHGQSGQGVLEDLLEAEELDNGEVDGGMEAQAALVRSDSGIELNAVAAVDLDLAVVVNPGNAEGDDALGLYKALDEACLLPLGVLVNDELQALKYLADCLKKLGLVGIALFDGVIDSLKILVCNHCFFLSY